MANDIRLGANFSIDISDLKAGLSTANRLIKENEAEFRSDAAALDNWTKSEEGLSKRQESLNKQIDIQKTKLDALRKEKERLIEEGKKQGKTDEEILKDTEKLNTQIEKESKTLDKMRGELDKTNKSLDEMNTENKDVAESSEKAEGGFTVMKGALASLAADGIKAALNGLKKLTSAIINAGSAADDLNALAKKSGFSTDELQKFEYAADIVDVAVTDIVGAGKKLKKNMTSETGDVADAFAAIGVSTRNEAGELRDMNDVFYDVLAGLSQIQNETQRDVYAMSIFGKNADELAGIIDDGGQALRDLGSEAEELGIIMSGETLDAANNFNDSVDKIKASSKGVLTSFLSELAGELAPELESVQKSIMGFIKSGKLKSFAKSATKTLKDIVTILVETGKTVLPALSKGLSWIAENFSTVAKVAGIAAGAFVALKAAMAIKSVISALSNPITAVVAGLTALGTALYVIGQNSEFGQLKKKIDDLTKSAADFSSAFDDTKKSVDDVAKAEDASIKKTEDLWKELQTLTDENGNVKKSDEERVDYILGELNEALGTEYERNGEIIGQYKEMQTEIDKLIKKKRAESLVSAYNDLYTQSTRDISELEKQRAEAGKALEEAQAKYDEIIADRPKGYYQGVYDLFTGFEYQRAKNNLDAAQDAYDELNIQVQKAEKTITTYEEAQDAIASQDFSTAIDGLKGLNHEFVLIEAKVGSKVAERIKNINEAFDTESRVLDELEKEYKEKYDKLTEREKEYYQERIKNASELLEEIKAQSKEYEVAGEIAGKNYLDGFEKGLDLSKFGIVDTPSFAPSIREYTEKVTSRNNNSSSGREVVINQTNNYSQEHSQYELYQTRNNTVNAVKMAMLGMVE